MIKLIRQYLLGKIRKLSILLGIEGLHSSMEHVLINQGKILKEINRQSDYDVLSDYEWSVFSQWGEDGIIQFLVNNVDIKNRCFIEFGVQDFKESNCRFLMMDSDWSGFIIDASEVNIEKIKRSYYYWRYDLQAIHAFIDVDNINALLEKSGFENDLGILSIDIDGVDYHILKAIHSFSPRILICEFNPVFGVKRSITVPYRNDFNRSAAHFSNLYFGASLPAFNDLMKGRGYTLIGTGKMGGNAFFVRNDLLNDRLRQLAKNPINFNANFRESRDRFGNLTFLSQDEALQLLDGQVVINTVSQEIEPLV